MSSSASTDVKLEEDPNRASISDRSPKICILGGGFGGLYTAIKLDELMWRPGLRPQVTLIDQSDRFVFKPLLYEILTESAKEIEVAPFFKDILEPFATSFIQARVEGIDISSEVNKGGAILLSDGKKVFYDWLVLAFGANANFYGIPGVMENALPFASYEDVQKVIQALSVLNEASGKSSQVVVVGGGYAGVELAAALATKIKNLGQQEGKGKENSQISITLITDTDTILPVAPISQRRAAEQQLSRNGVFVKTGFLVKSIKNREQDGYGLKIIDLESRTEKETTQIEADLALWTAGSMPATKTYSNNAFPFERTPFGSLRTEPTLKLVNQKRVFALGDDAFIEDPTKDTLQSQFPATAQVALQQADYVAFNLWADINNRSLLPFRYQHLGDMMSLGSQNAAIALPISLPTEFTNSIRNSFLYPLTRWVGLEFGEGENPRDQRVTFDGPLAVFMRRLSYWYRQPTNDQKTKIVQKYFDEVVRVLSSKSDSKQGRD